MEEQLLPRLHWSQLFIAVVTIFYHYEQDSSRYITLVVACSFFLSTVVLLEAPSAHFFYLREGGTRGAPSTVSFTAKTDTRSRWLWRCNQGLPTYLTV